jgi:hypothetical protein
MHQPELTHAGPCSACRWWLASCPESLNPKEHGDGWGWCQNEARWGFAGDSREKGAGFEAFHSATCSAYEKAE